MASSHFLVLKYLLDERGFTAEQASLSMVLLLVFLSIGYILGGMIGDSLFKRTKRGRAILGTIVVFTSAILIYLTLNVPFEDVETFIIMSSLTALIIPMASANVGAIIFDVTEPEVRSTARGLLRVLENSGSALAPLVAGIIADMYSLHLAILWITITWIICGAFFSILTLFIERY